MNKAFDTLSDPAKRDTYDRHGPEAVDGAPHMHNPFAGFGGGGGGANFHSADLDELLRTMFGGGAAFGGGFGGMPHGFAFGGGMPRARAHPHQHQQQQQQQQQHGGQGTPFANPFAGMNPASLLPLLPVLLMLFGQLVSVLPFLARVRGAGARVTLI